MHTAPATLLLLLTPYLSNSPFFDVKTLLLATLFVLFHYLSFGHNSLMDASMMYDQRDKNKQHHPLVSGTIKLHEAHNVIHWGLSLAVMVAGVVTVFWASNITFAFLCLLGWVAFGHAYNDGLSKESLVGFLAISLSITASGGWGWFLSHNGLNLQGSTYLCYVFFTILYQISWSGFVKEMQVREKSNILSRMGACLDVTLRGEKKFIPGKARFYAYFVKGINLFLGCLLLYQNFSLVGLVMLVLLGSVAIFCLYKTTRERVYNRGKELFLMSIMEIATIYLPIPLMLGPVEATTLMVIGVVYFFAINKVLWGKPYPRV